MLIKWPMPPATLCLLKKELVRLQKVIDLRGEEMLKEVEKRFGLRWEEAEKVG